MVGVKDWATRLVTTAKCVVLGVSTFISRSCTICASALLDVKENIVDIFVFGQHGPNMKMCMGFC